MSRPPLPQFVLRIIGAALLDFLTAFFGFGWLIGWLTGGLVEGGFSLQGNPAWFLFAGVLLYFIIGVRLGGPIWFWLLGVSPRGLFNKRLFNKER